MTTTTETEATGNGENAAETKTTIPCGKYKLVGWDMDITGKQLTDEICQIAGYTPDTQYSQYVMPYKDLNRNAKMRFALKVITITKFRMLKDTKSNKIVKTKSEVSALSEFVAWLQTVKGDSDGIILIHHEFRQILPAILLECLKKYDFIYSEFTKLVKGFLNTCDMAKASGKTSGFTMRALIRNYLNKEVEDDDLINATSRAKFAYDIAGHFITKSEEDSTESKCNIDSMDSIKIYDYIHDFVQTIEEEEMIRTELKAVIQRENTLTPIFATLLRFSRERQQATPLRRLLAEAEIEYDQLEKAWKDTKKDGLEKLINEKMKNVSAKEQQKILYIVECYFDEEKAEELKHELEKPKIGKKRKRFAKKLDTTNNIDSGNDSGDNTLTQSPTKIEITDPNENEIEVAAV